MDIPIQISPSAGCILLQVIRTKFKGEKGFPQECHGITYEGPVIIEGGLSSRCLVTGCVQQHQEMEKEVETLMILAASF